MAERAVRSAARRRERWLRSMWRHEQLSVRMAVATASHHSWKSHAVVGTQTEYAGVAGPVPVTEYVAPAHAVAPFSSPAVTYEAPAPVFEYVAPTPAVTFAAPAPVVGYVAPAPAVTYAAPAPVIDYVAPAHSVTYAVPAPVIDYVAPAHSVTYAVPAPVIDFVAPAPSVTFSAPAPVFEYVTPAPVFGFIAPAPAGSFVAPSQQLRPAYTDDAAVVVSASQVVGSLPHGEVFSAPVSHQVHHVPLAGGGIPENLVDLPVVPEQVDFLRVVARRPPPLVDVMPSSRAHRHFMEDLGELAPSVQLLDLPVPQMVENVTDTLLRNLDFPIAEQVIDVPKIFCSPCPSRSRVPEPQSADQLVEVPTVLSPTRIALQIAEQIVDTPVHLPESVEWVQLRDEATSRPYFWNRRTRETKWKPPPGIRVVWVGVTTEGGGIWYWHKGTRASTYELPPLPPG